MLFNSYIFLIFLGIVLLPFYLLKNRQWRKIWLLLSSLFFYAYWNWSWVSLLLFSIISNFYLGRKIHSSQSHQKSWLRTGIVLNLSILAVVKYFNFFSESILSVFQKMGMHPDSFHLNILLPIGVSFFTFQSIAYLMDVYRKDVEPTDSLIDFGLFKSFFPQLIAGPIERAKHMLPQFNGRLFPNKIQLYEGVFLICIGMFQKVMIGDACGRIVDAVFFDFSKYATFEILSALLLFTFQIYADFSGYSNIARGLGKLFGVELMVNFRQPYFSENVQEFWHRWHISLSEWLRDYLYFPLGGNQKGTTRTYINILIVMALGGLWHGAGWNYIVWGLYHGLLLVLFRKYNWSTNSRFLNIFITFLLVTVGWFFFRITSTEQLHLFMNQLRDFTFGEYPARFLKMVVAFGLTSFLIDWLQVKYKNDAILTVIKNRSLALGIASSLLVVSFLYILIKKPFPFIYFQF